MSQLLPDLIATAATLELGLGNFRFTAQSATEGSARNFLDSAYANLHVLTPSSDSHAATKLYVDTLVVNNRSWIEYVTACTTAALPANTVGGGGNTLTGNVNGALAAQDGVTLLAGEDVLVANEGTAANNGPYTVTQVGDGSNPYILTRRELQSSGDDATAAACTVSEGVTKGDTVQQQTADNAIYGTTALVYVTASNQAVTGGEGIEVTGANVINIDLAVGSGLQFTSSELEIAPLAITTARLVDAAVTNAKLGLASVEDDNRLNLVGVVLRYNTFAFTDGTVSLLDGNGVAALETNTSYVTYLSRVCIFNALDDGTASVVKIDPLAVQTTIQTSSEISVTREGIYDVAQCEELAANAAGGWTFNLILVPGSASTGDGACLVMCFKTS